jgi:hypothetical protein
MFVLTEAVHYEGESVIGLYSTLKLAQAAAESYCLRGHHDDRSEGFCSDCWDDLLVYEVSADAPAFWRSESVWSMVASRKAAAE